MSTPFGESHWLEQVCCRLELEVGAGKGEVGRRRGGWSWDECPKFQNKILLIFLQFLVEYLKNFLTKRWKVNRCFVTLSIVFSYISTYIVCNYYFVFFVFVIIILFILYA